MTITNTIILLSGGLDEPDIEDLNTAEFEALDFENGVNLYSVFGHNPKPFPVKRK